MRRCAGSAVLFTTALVASVPSAFAEDTAEALTNFGLIGTWSQDCAKEFKDGGVRSTYAASVFGNPRVETMIGLPDGRVDIQHSEIMSAVRVTEEKLKITWMLLDKTDDGKPVEPRKRDRVPNEAILIKAGSKIRTFEARKKDGSETYVSEGFVYTIVPKDEKKPVMERDNQRWVKTEKESIPLEKCLN